VSHGQTAGFLGKEHEPFCYRVTARNEAPGLDPARLQQSKAIVEAVDALHCDVETSNATYAADAATEQALATLFSSRAKRAFDVDAEPEAVRARYGWNTFGQSCLLARRLVQHGVRLVTVNMFDTVFNRITWDCHANGGDLQSTLHDYKETLCPMLDAAYSALLDDLHDTGLLE